MPAPAMPDTAWLACASFPFDHPEPARSLYAYAPVFYIRDRLGEWVVKRTGLVGSRGEAIARWTARLRAYGVGIVSPEPRFRPNPRRLTDGIEWVVYPYIAGRDYRASEDQLDAAGRLLAHIHLHGREEAAALRSIPVAPRHDAAWLAPHVVSARHHLLACSDSIHIIDGLLARSVGEIPPLPLAGGSADFKAANIVFAETAILVDPDHAALMPRLYDLATAVLLFHSDCLTAPHRLWTGAEWRWFRNAYLGLVNLSENEFAAWYDVLVLAWRDQALWLLANFPEGWLDIAERAYLIDLAGFDPAAYPLIDE